MSDLPDTQWFAIQARPCAEAAAELSLRTLSIETFLPLIRRPIRHATRRVRLAARAFFPGYLFARFCPADSLRTVSYCRGVVRVLGTSDRPIPVEDSIIASIRTRVGADGCVELEQRQFRTRDCVRIASGPLGGWSGVFEQELSDSERVVILIEALRQGRVIVSRDLLELVEAA